MAYQWKEFLPCRKTRIIAKNLVQAHLQVYCAFFTIPFKAEDLSIHFFTYSVFLLKALGCRNINQSC